MIFLRRKIPVPLKICLGMGLSMIALAIVTLLRFNGNKSGIFEGTIFLALLLCWFYLEHSGYKFGYSNSRVLSRPAGLVWEPLPRRHHFSEVEYSDIREVRKIFQGNAKAKQNFFAFDYLGIEGNDGQTVMLYPDGMRHEDFRMMLQKIYQKRPDLFVKKWQKNLVGVE